MEPHKSHAGYVFTVDSLPVTAEQLGKATQVDPILTQESTPIHERWMAASSLRVSQTLLVLKERNHCRRRLPYVGHQSNSSQEAAGRRA